VENENENRDSKDSGARSGFRIESFYFAFEIIFSHSHFPFSMLFTPLFFLLIKSGAKVNVLSLTFYLKQTKQQIKTSKSK